MDRTDQAPQQQEEIVAYLVEGMPFLTLEGAKRVAEILSAARGQDVPVLAFGHFTRQVHVATDPNFKELDY